MKQKIILAGIGLALVVSAAAKTFNVLDFGAKGDGVTLDTLAIQKTIEAAATNGGMVLVPRQKTFLVSTLNLRVELISIWRARC